MAGWNLVKLATLFMHPATGGRMKFKHRRKISAFCPTSKCFSLSTLQLMLPLFLVAVGARAQAPHSNEEASMWASAHMGQASVDKKAEETLADLKRTWKLDDNHAFRKHADSKDLAGKQHLRYQMTFGGLPVHGVEVIIHLDEKGNPEEPTLTRTAPVALANEHSISIQDALDALGKQLNLKINPSQATVEQVVFPIMARVVHGKRAFQAQSGHPLVNADDIEDRVDKHVLAFKILLNPSLNCGLHLEDNYILDAGDGSILERWSNSASGTPATGTGASYYSGTVQLSTVQEGNFYYPTGNGFALNDAGNRAYQTHYNQVGWAFADVDNIWGDGSDYSTANPTLSPNGQTAMVDAKYGLDNVRQFYSTVFGRTGGNGVGSSGTIQCYVHVDFGSANANSEWWYDPGSLNWVYRISFGNGDLRSYSPTKSDIVAHEWTHLVTYANTHLNSTNGETGGVHEGFSDIFSGAFKVWMENGRTTTLGDASTLSNWLYGLIGRDGRALRCMYDPKNINKAFQDYNSINRVVWEPSIISEEFHGAAGPMNRCFFFLTEGFNAFGGGGPSSNFLPYGITKIGMDKAIRIWYQAMNYMGDQSTYPTVYNATLRAAMDLYGYESQEYQSVENAFACINIGNGHGPIINEVELGNAIGDAQIIPQGNTSFIIGTNYDPSDVDYYRFTLPTGQTLRLTLNHVNAGFPTSDLNLQIVNAGGQVLGLVGPQGRTATQPIMIDPGDGSTDPLIAEYTNGSTAPQAVYARVSSSTTNSRYRLISRAIIYPLY